MTEPVAKAPTEGSRQPEILNLDRVPGVVWGSAVDAFVKSILVMVFGNLILGIAGGIFGQMTPSAPPGFGSQPEAESTSSIPWASWRGGLREHQFLVVFVVVLVSTIWARLTSGEGNGEKSQRVARLGRMRRHFSKDWFGLIVGNALGAMISAMVLNWVQQFTPTKLLFGWLLGSLWTGLQGLVQDLSGAHGAESLTAWVNWYGDNQLKFTFWALYLASVCDDLGIPNLKTLGRWLGRRFRKRMRSLECRD
jgi:hypothetical protein